VATAWATEQDREKNRNPRHPPYASALDALGGARARAQPVHQPKRTFTPLPGFLGSDIGDDMINRYASSERYRKQHHAMVCVALVISSIAAVVGKSCVFQCRLNRPCASSAGGQAEVLEHLVSAMHRQFCWDLPFSEWDRARSVFPWLAESSARNSGAANIR